MNNRELVESLKSENLSKESKKIINSGLNIIGKSIDLCTSIPIFDIATSFTKGLIAIRDFRTLKMIAHFFEEFDSLSWNERTEFSYHLQNDPNFEDFTEKIIFYLDSLQEKNKAGWIGKMALGLARKKINMEQFDLAVFVIKNSMPGDLILLKKVFDHAIEERKSDLIPITDEEWFNKHVYKFIGLHYYDESDEKKSLSSRTINHFISLGLIDRELKEIKKRNRDLGIDSKGEFNDGYKEVFSISNIGKDIYFFALKD